MQRSPAFIEFLFENKTESEPGQISTLIFINFFFRRLQITINFCNQQLNEKETLLELLKWSKK